MRRAVALCFLLLAPLATAGADSVGPMARTKEVLTRSHDIVGGVDPAHPDCPEIVQAGFLTPGQSRETGTFTSARTCEYHDHTALGVPAFQGRIIIR